MTDLLGLTPAEPAKHKNDGAKYPKWVVVHPSHLAEDATGTISVPGFGEFHKNRATGEVEVLVQDSAEEAKAKAVKPLPPPDEPPAPAAPAAPPAE